MLHLFCLCKQVNTFLYFGDQLQIKFETYSIYSAILCATPDASDRMATDGTLDLRSVCVERFFASIFNFMICFVLFNRLAYVAHRLFLCKSGIPGFTSKNASIKLRLCDMESFPYLLQVSWLKPAFDSFLAFVLQPSRSFTVETAGGTNAGKLLKASFSHDT